MNAGNLKLYDLARNDLHLPDNKAMEFVISLGEFFEKHQAKQDEILATKAELLTAKSELKTEMLAFRSELKQEIHAVAVKVENMQIKMDTQMASKVDLAEAKSELKHYYFVGSLVQYIVLTATILTIIRYMMVK
jgi:hypothetical protein